MNDYNRFQNSVYKENNNHTTLLFIFLSLIHAILKTTVAALLQKTCENKRDVRFEFKIIRPINL